MEQVPAFLSPLERQLWIISTLKLRGSSLAEVARQNGIGRGALDNALHRPADAAEKIIAEALGVTQRALFPERFNTEGQRIFRVRRKRELAAA